LKKWIIDVVLTSKHLLLALMLFTFSASIYSGEPKLDHSHSINSTGWIWRIDSQDTDVLKLFKADSKKPTRNYDLAGCMFCSGQDDGCDQDGIFDISLQQALNEPIVVAVCHVGAHSRMLQIFAPNQDKQEAVHTVTGDFVIDYDIDPQGITINYDRRNEDGQFDQKSSRWPRVINVIKK